MSRLSTLSPEAIKSLFSPDADSNLITLLSFDTGTEIIRLADGYTQRISETDDDILYGVVSNSQDYIFLPFEIILPTEEDEGVPRCSITIHDVTRRLTPIIRQMQESIPVTLQLVLSSTPDVVEIEFGGFLLGGVTYDANTITAELQVESLVTEPFPAHTCTPSTFPGMF